MSDGMTKILTVLSLVASLGVVCVFFFCLGQAQTELDNKVDLATYNAFVARMDEKFNLAKRVEDLETVSGENHDAVITMELFIRKVLQEEGLIQ